MVFCIKIDHNFLDRGLALYTSLRQFHPDAQLVITALTPETHAFLRDHNLKGVHVVTVETIAKQHPEISSIRGTRTEAEFAFTLTPFTVLEALKKARRNELVVYLDADTMLFNSLSGILQEQGEADVMRTPHNFSSHMVEQRRYGMFNTAFTVFRNSEQGTACASWWADCCLEWCYDRLEGEKFTDQKYIEQFCRICPTTITINHIGLNCAPWNVSGRRFASDGRRVTVDGRPLILYHYAKVRRVRPWCIATRTKLQGVIRAKGLHRHVYKPYAKMLEQVSFRYRVPRDWILTRGEKRSGAKHRVLAKDVNPGFFRIASRLLRGDYVASGSCFVSGRRVLAMMPTSFAV